MWNVKQWICQDLKGLQNASAWTTNGAPSRPSLAPSAHGVWGWWTPVPSSQHGVRKRSPYDPCPQSFFPPPIWIFGHIFPNLKKFSHKNIVENEIYLMENTIYPPKMCRKKFSTPKFFLERSPCGNLSPPSLTTCLLMYGSTYIIDVLVFTRTKQLWNDTIEVH